MYSKATETAIAALSRLAEVYDGGKTRLSASEIAESRGLPNAFASKILWTLSQAGYIDGVRGPGGGFSFAVHPRTLTLYDAYSLFEHEDESTLCIFGGGVCGNGDKCPLHDRQAKVRQMTNKVLHETSFDVFRLAYKKNQGKANWQCHDSSRD
ncbi:MAG: Rrf2 family transcriptional regulator [Pirellulaceae bacterium]|nr:Rrf2 family transcriptional regulator [Pirellulaceae bacterium]